MVFNLASGCWEVSRWEGAVQVEGTARGGKRPGAGCLGGRTVSLSFASKTDQGSLSAVVRRRQPWPFQRPPGRILVCD